MTREEITKEAQEQVNYCTPLHPEDFIHGYIAGAESREKRIEEENNKLLDVINNQDVKIADLEKKLEQTEEDLADYQFNYPTIKELSKENEELKKKCYKKAVKDYCKLEKENAKLKDANATLYTMNNNMWVELEEKRAESQGITNRLHQLIKAKELLAKWVELFRPKGGNIPPTPIQVETEQFLKEIE